MGNNGSSVQHPAMPGAPLPARPTVLGSRDLEESRDLVSLVPGGRGLGRAVGLQVGGS